MTLRAGVATADITPPTGHPIGGFPDKPGRLARTSEGAHDPLKARALVLSDGDETVAVCACDLAMVRRVDVARIREAVAARVPELAGARLSLAGSHTHSGPENIYLFGATPDDPWIHEMDARIADAVVRAHGALRPAALRVGRAHAPLAHNRRLMKDNGMGMIFDYDPALATGPSDADAPVLRLDGDDGEPIAVVYRFAAHALTAGPGLKLFTADYPGVASARLEARWPGSTALFLNGGAGNQHPRKSMRTKPDEAWAVMDEIGGALADAVAPALEAAEPVEDPRLGIASATMTFANRVDPSLTVEVELVALRLGPAVLGFMPGEPYIELQLRFKEAVAPDLGVFVGYANGWPGYVPVREVYAEGGYGVDLCELDPPALSRTALPEGAAEALLDRLLVLARSA